MPLEFIQTYFVDPILYGTGYNAVNTTVFAVILIAAIFGVYKLLRALKIPIDKRFSIGIVPFIILGGVLRSLEDLAQATGAAKNPFFITPGIYITLFGIALGSLLLAKALERAFHGKWEYYKIWFALGVVFTLIGISQMRLVSVFGLYTMLGITLGWAAVLFVIRAIGQKKNNAFITKFLTKENTFLILAHMFDATTTFVTLQFFPNYFEQHVLPSFFIGIVGPAVMFPLKLLVVPVVLYVFDKEMKKPEEQQKKTLLKIAVLVLGLGPGTRNFLRLVMQV